MPVSETPALPGPGDRMNRSPARLALLLDHHCFAHERAAGIAGKEVFRCVVCGAERDVVHSIIELTVWWSERLSQCAA